MENLSIGKVSKAVGLPTKTIRFYEESGIITPPQRSENGYRTYTPLAIDELKMIKYARDLGVPLIEIKKLMKGCQNGDCEHSKDYIEETISAYLVKVEKQILQLKLLQKKLEDLKHKINRNEINCDKNKYCCNIFEQMIGGETKNNIVQRSPTLKLRRTEGGDNNGMS